MQPTSLGVTPTAARASATELESDIRLRPIFPQVMDNGKEAAMRLLRMTNHRVLGANHYEVRCPGGVWLRANRTIGLCFGGVQT